jgi:L-aminopeptidase/D-esterase-like protein
MPVVVLGKPGEILREAVMGGQQDEISGRLPGWISVGHWSDLVGMTGCTVVLAPGGAVGGVDVRGGALGTLGTDALHAGTVIDQVHGVLLTGGSTFGLAAAGGVMRYLEERGVGLPFGPVRVPVVVGAILFDLLTGDPAARPGSDAGYAACAAAGAMPAQGAVGVGTGATVAKAGTSEARPGGVGIASAAASGAG